jgi:threonine/homoserine/homoserine lactone efflux protein
VPAVSLLAWTGRVTASLFAFPGVSALVIVTPGPDTAVTASSTAGGGRRGGVCTAPGVSCGQAVRALTASAGISAVLAAGRPAFLTLKYLGAACLAYPRAPRDLVRGQGQPDPPAAGGGPARRGALACYRRGLLSDPGNPKMAVFFTSLLPQSGAGFAVLALPGLVFCAMTFLWLACYAVALATMGDLLRRSPVRRAPDAVTGAVLIAPMQSVLCRGCGAAQ